MSDPSFTADELVEGILEAERRGEPVIVRHLLMMLKAWYPREHRMLQDSSDLTVNA